MSAWRVSVFVTVLPSPPSLSGSWKHKVYFHSEGKIQQELRKFRLAASVLVTPAVNKWLKRSTCL